MHKIAAVASSEASKFVPLSRLGSITAARRVTCPLDGDAKSQLPANPVQGPRVQTQLTRPQLRQSKPMEDYVAHHRNPLATTSDMQSMQSRTRKGGQATCKLRSSNPAPQVRNRQAGLPGSKPAPGPSRNLQRDVTQPHQKLEATGMCVSLGPLWRTLCPTIGRVFPSKIHGAEMCQVHDSHAWPAEHRRMTSQHLFVRLA